MRAACLAVLLVLEMVVLCKSATSIFEENDLKKCCEPNVSCLKSQNILSYESSPAICPHKTYLVITKGNKPVCADATAADVEKAIQCFQQKKNCKWSKKCRTEAKTRFPQTKNKKMK